MGNLDQDWPGNRGKGDGYVAKSRYFWFFCLFDVLSFLNIDWVISQWSLHLTNIPGFTSTCLFTLQVNDCFLLSVS